MSHNFCPVTVFGGHNLLGRCSNVKMSDQKQIGLIFLLIWLKIKRVQKEEA